MQQVVNKIKDEQWNMTMPPDFQTSSKRPTTLREIVNYHAYEDAWIPAMLAGKTMAEAGAENFKGDLLGDDPKGNFGKLVESAIAAARDFSDFERTVHCSFGDFSAREYFWQLNMFRGLRAHDIARVIGVDSTLPDELVQGLWDELSPVAEEWRQMGLFQAKVEVPADARLQDKLLGLTGRRPA